MRFRNLLLTLALLLGLSVPAAATTLTGTVRYPDGSGVNGQLSFALTQQGAVSGSGGCPGPYSVVPNAPVIFKLTNGALPATAAVVGNDCISPSGTRYTVTVRDSQGNILFSESWSINGPSVDVGTLTGLPPPLVANISLIPFSGITLGTNTGQTLTVGTGTAVKLSGTGAVDLSGGTASAFKVPTGPGLAPSATGAVAYDTTANQFRGGVNNIAVKIPTFGGGSDPVTNDCVKWGPLGTLADHGAICGASGGGGGATPAYTLVPFTATMAFTASGTDPNGFKTTLTGNVTSSTLANAVPGQILEWDICQDSTGNRTFTFPPNVVGAVAISSVAGSCTRETFMFDGTSANFNSAVVTGASLSGDNTWTAAQRFKSGVPWYDITGFGARGSTITTGATTTSGSAVVTLGAAGDFKNGDGVFFDNFTPPFCSSIISGAGGLSITLANNAPGSSSTTMYHDDGAAIQVAIDTASAVVPSMANQPGAGVVYGPPGKFNATCAPIHMHGQNVRLQGAGKRSFTLTSANPNVKIGPGFVYTPDVVAYLPSGYLGANLLTGGTQSFNVAGNQSFYIDFRNCPTCAELNGRGTLTVEAAINLTTLTSDVGVLVSSGVRDSIDGYRNAMSILVRGSGALQCDLTTTSGKVAIQGAAGAITAGTTYTVALTYDGSNLRCFLNGTQISGSPAAQTGTIVQGPLEQVRTSGDIGIFPNSNSYFYPAMNGRIDGIRISSTARYTANYTAPTAKWPEPADASTMVQVNFDNQQDVFTVGQSGSGTSGGTVYIPFINNCAAQGGNNVAIDGVNFDYNHTMIIGGGGAPNVYHINTTGGLYYGGGCAFYGEIEDVAYGAYNGRYGLMYHNGPGKATHLIDTADTAAVGTLFQGGSELNYLTQSQRSAGAVIGLLVQAGSVAGGGISFTQDPYVITNVVTDTEGASSTLKTMIMFDNIGLATLKMSVIECVLANVNCIPITLQNVGAVRIQDVSVAPGSAVLNPIHVAGVVQKPIVIEASMSAPSCAPGVQSWVDRAGAAIVIGGQFGGNTGSAKICWIGSDDPNIVDIAQFPLTVEQPNNTVTGTCLYCLATSSAGALVAPAAATNGVIGVVVGNGTKTGNAQIVPWGYVPCSFENAVTKDDWVQIGTTQNGACRDAGAARPTSGGQILGKVTGASAAFPVGPPGAAPTVTTATTGGTIAAGTYRLCLTHVNGPGGESVCGPEATITTTGSTSTITVTSLQAGGGNPTGILGVRTYVTAVGGGVGTETLQSITTANCGPALAQTTLPNTCNGPSLIGGINAVTFVFTSLTTNGTAPPGASTNGPWVQILLYSDVQAGGGGTGTPGGSTTQLQFNDLGAFGGTSNGTFTKATGVYNFSQLANGNELHRKKRFTDTSPTGIADRLRNAADTLDLYSLDVLGNLIGNSGTFNSPGAGMVAYLQGTTRAVPGDCPGGTGPCIVEEAPTSVTSYVSVKPGVSATGFLRGTNVSNTNTQSFAAASGVGACPAGQFVTTTNDNAAPACAAPSPSSLTLFPSVVEFPIGTCTSTTASTSAWDTPASGTAGTAVCITDGSNVHSKPALNFANSGTPEWWYTLLLPSDLAGTADMRLVWQTATASGTATFNLDVICVSASNQADTTAFSAGNFMAPAAQTASSTANNLNLVTVAGQAWPASCTAGTFAHFRLKRTDTGTAVTASVVDLQLTLRRTF